MYKRRSFLAALALSALAGSSSTKVQGATNVPKLCFLAPSALQHVPWYSLFFQRLRALGYIDGQSISIHYLSADDHAERFRDLARECVRLKADIIVATTTPAALAAKNATQTIPIVLLGTGEPVLTGIVSNLARPGANITGLSHMAPGLSGKRLGLLKDALPRISSVMVLSYLTDPIAPPQVNEIKNAASALGVKLHVHDIRSADDLPVAFDVAVKDHSEAVLTTVESIFVIHRAMLIELTARYRLPAIYPSRTFVDAGGLMSYGVNFPTFWMGAATYVDKILKGANPGDLPIEQPTEFELVINLRTAKAMGITMPQSILLRADEVIG